jgi:hypothetical protein
MKKQFITAHAFIRERGRIVQTTVRVPVTFGSIPTVPLVIKFEKDYYVRTSNSPLEYTSASFGKATL